MLIFLSAVAVVLIVSFLCSIFESVLLSITRPQIEVLGRRHARAASLRCCGHGGSGRCPDRRRRFSGLLGLLRHGVESVTIRTNCACWPLFLPVKTTRTVPSAPGASRSTSGSAAVLFKST